MESGFEAANPLKESRPHGAGAEKGGGTSAGFVCSHCKEETMNHSNHYEQEAVRQIEEWRNRKGGLLDSALVFISRPIGWAYEKFVPGSLQKSLEKAVLGGVEMLKDAAHWTYSEKHIVQDARELGIFVEDFRDLAKYDLERLDRLAQKYFLSNKLIAALEGAGCGLGGLVLVAADIPALFTVSLRAVLQIGSSYGFDMRDPAMFPVILSVFNAGSCTEVGVKAAALADMKVVAKALAKGWTYKKVAERTQTGVIIQLLKERTKGLPREIANSVTKRKLGQLIPVAGPIIGAGFNYWFLSNVCLAAYMIFRSMHLARNDKGGNEPPWATSPSPAHLCPATPI